MALNHATYTTRPVSFVLLAALAGFALWLFVPALVGGGSSPGGTESAPSQLPSMLARDGDVTVETTDGHVTRIVVPVALRGDDPIDLADGTMRAETALAETALAAVPATYSVAWPADNGDTLLEPGETALLKVDLPANNNIDAANPLDLVLTLEAGPRLVIQDVLGR